MDQGRHGRILPHAVQDRTARNFPSARGRARPMRISRIQASLSRVWPTNSLLTNDGGMLLIESRPDEFFVVGSGLTVKMSRDPDTDSKVGGIASIEEVSRTGAEWT